MTRYDKELDDPNERVRKNALKAIDVGASILIAPLALGLYAALKPKDEPSKPPLGYFEHHR